MISYRNYIIVIIIIIITPRTRSVSYTHLDVYKRQFLLSSFVYTCMELLLKQLFLYFQCLLFLCFVWYNCTPPEQTGLQHSMGKTSWLRRQQAVLHMFRNLLYGYSLSIAFLIYRLCACIDIQRWKKKKKRTNCKLFCFLM